MIYYLIWYTILYTHGPLQSVDHLYVMRNIYDKQYTNREKDRNNIYMTSKGGYVICYIITIQDHRVIESWSDMIGYTHALSACVCCILTSQCHSHRQL
jgi:uncharacterized membrane protein YkgB